MVLAALAGGVLNSLEHFFAPALAPVLLNLCLIAAALWVAPYVDPPVLALALTGSAIGIARRAVADFGDFGATLPANAPEPSDSRFTRFSACSSRS